MSRRPASLVAVVLALAALALRFPTVASSQGGPPPGGPGGPPPGGPGGRPGGPAGPRPGWAAVDSFAAERDSMAKAVLASIAGREHMAAESVFKEIRVMKGVPAGRLVRAMEMGFGRSLGVRCTHCHVAGRWESEEKKQKQVARDMMAMSDTITRVMLARIPNLQSAQPRVNCGTCHRGTARPGADDRPRP